MKLGAVADVLIEGARRYRNSPNAEAKLASSTGRPIDTDLAKELITPLLTLCNEVITEEDVRVGLQERLKKWAPSALERIHLNQHMNTAGGGSTLNQDTADALIVDFVNFACIPLDLGLYARDLQ